MDKLAEDILKRQKQLENIRHPWEQLWQDIADHVIPIREDVEQGLREGQRQATKIYDGTAVSALQLFADGLHGYLISPAILWFRLKMARSGLTDIPDVSRWLQEVQVLLYEAFQRSNFYAAMNPYFEDGGSIGTATIYSEEDLDQGRVVFTTMHPAQIYIAENQFGEVDTVFRKCKLEARKAIQKFGARVSGSLRQAAEHNAYQQYPFIHAVYPRESRDVQKSDARNKRFASVWVEMGANEVVRESGYDQLPYSVWRYKKSSNETYGRSPAMFALADILGINQISKTLLGAAHLAVDPAYNVPAELAGKVRITPRGMNYYDNEKRLVFPIQTGSTYPVGVDREDRKRQAIEDHFKVDFFLMLARASRQMTATEIIERQGEKAAILGTAVGRLNSECLNPIMDRVFQIEYDAGRLPPPPEVLMEMAGERIDVDYMGPLAQAQKRLFRTQGVTHSLEHLRPVAELKPEVFDIIDFDEVAREVLDSNGFPQRAILPPEQVMAFRQARAEAQRQAQAREDLMSASGAVKTLAEADRASGGALVEALGQMPGTL